MKKLISILFILATVSSCYKDDSVKQTSCNLQQVKEDNASKVTITNGIWGTISNMEGNCMPVIGGTSSTCKNCPVQRTIKIYQYTLASDATPSNNPAGLYNSFNATLVAQADSDENGFFQIDVPKGHYSYAVVQNGKLYATGMDEQGGLNPFTFTSGTLNLNIQMTYGAAF